MNGPEDSLPTLNRDLLLATWRQIKDHPETWEQDEWRCATGMCFAGWAAQLAGGVWSDDHSGLLIAEPGDEESGAWLGPRQVIHAMHRAQRVLGITDHEAGGGNGGLFSADNDLADIRAHLTELLGRDPDEVQEP